MKESCNYLDKHRPVCLLWLYYPDLLGHIVTQLSFRANQECFCAKNYEYTISTLTVGLSMHLAPREFERLWIFLAAELARRRRARGLKLNYPEAYALIADEISEGARDGRTVAELMSYGAMILNTDDVEPGTEILLDAIMVEAMFTDGQKLVCVHDPIRVGTRPPERTGPGEVRLAKSGIKINEGRETKRLLVRNKGDRPIQIGSHYHFFEVNPALEFDRRSSFGYRLNIPAGTSVRFEPGDEQQVSLVALGGERAVNGLAGLTKGKVTTSKAMDAALARAVKQGYFFDE